MLRLFVGMDNSLDAANDSTVFCSECSDSITDEPNLVGEKSINSLQEKVTLYFLPLLWPKCWGSGVSLIMVCHVTCNTFYQIYW